mmetsp:Transcript_9547/g.18110  ORF Transcript_9547/g.18110 Transcript_9547/m.18110 type:complete len:1058 (+) Transcript_9547:19-3192(+)
MISKRWCCCGLVFQVFSVIFLGLALIIPPIIDDAISSQLKSNLGLSQSLYEQNSSGWNQWAVKKQSLEATFWNLTNPDQVLNGTEKPLLQEVGPYVFYNNLENYNFAFPADTDNYHEVEFNHWQYFYFDREKTAAHLDPDKDFITSGNLVLQAVYGSTKDNKLESNIVDLYADLKKHDWKEILYTKKTPSEWMFGYTEDKLFTYPGVQPNLTKDESTALGSFTMYTGEDDPALQFQWRSFHGQESVTVPKSVLTPNQRVPPWAGEEANRIHGTDGNMFAPKLPPGSVVAVWSDQLKRELPLANLNNSTQEVEGITVTNYVIAPETLHNVSLNPDNNVFYMFGPSGVFNQTSAQQGNPLFISQPHFLGADPRFAEAVSGMHPDKEKHQLLLGVEPLTGTTMLGLQRFQVNVLLTPLQVKDEKWFENLKTVTLPICWIQSGGKITPDQAAQFQELMTGEAIKSGVQYGGIVFSVILTVAGCLSLLYSRDKLGHETSGTLQAVRTEHESTFLYYLETTSKFFFVIFLPVLGGMLNRYRGGWCQWFFCGADGDDFTHDAFLRLAFAVPTSVLVGLLVWFNGMKFRLGDVAPEKETVVSPESRNFRKCSCHFWPLLHASVVCLVFCALTFFSLFVGWGTYMDMGRNADSAGKRAGIFDWLLGVSYSTTDYGSRWQRDAAAMSLRGLLQTVPTGLLLRRVGVNALPVMSGVAMGLVYEIGWSSSLYVKGFMHRGTEVAEFLWGYWIWLCLLLAFYAAQPARHTARRTPEEQQEDKHVRLVTYGFVVRAKGPLREGGEEEEQSCCSCSGERAFFVARQLALLTLEVLFVGSLVSYSQVEQEDTRNLHQTLIGLAFCTAALVTSQIVDFVLLCRARRATKAAEPGASEASHGIGKSFDYQAYRDTQGSNDQEDYPGMALPGYPNDSGGRFRACAVCSWSASTVNAFRSFMVLRWLPRIPSGEDEDEPFAQLGAAVDEDSDFDAKHGPPVHPAMVGGRKHREEKKRASLNNQDDEESIVKSGVSVQLYVVPLSAFFFLLLSFCGLLLCVGWSFGVFGLVVSCWAQL